MTNCFKKHWFLIIGILLLSNYSFGQTFIDLHPDEQVTNKVNGRPFKIRLKATSDIAAECTGQVITLDIGNLEYLPGSNSPTPAGITITPVVTNGRTILTIRGIVNDGREGFALSMDIGMQFAPGTCDGVAADINATTTNLGCTVESNQSGTIRVTSLTPNNEKIKITQSGYQPTPVCPLKVLKYRIELSNTGNQGFNNTDVKVNLELDKCAQVLAIYKEYTYIPVDAVTTISNGKKNVVFSTPDLLLSPYTYSSGYDLYVTYPCVSGDANVDCVSGLKEINAYLTGTKMGCGLPMRSLTSTSTIETTISTSICGNVSCGTAGGELQAISLGASINLPCPSCAKSDPILGVVLYIPPFHPSYPDRVITIDLPLEADVTSAYANTPTPCGTQYTVVYIDAQGNRQTTPFGGSLNRKVEFKSECGISDPDAIFFFKLKYNSLTGPSQYLGFKLNFTSAGKKIYEGSTGQRVSECVPSLGVYNQVRKATQPVYENNFNVSAIPGELLTYRLELRNWASGDTNNSIDIKLDDNLVYKGDFRYVYQTYNVNNSNEFKALGANSSFTVNELGTINVTRPAVDAYGGNINLSGFSYPCTNNRLFIEFNVQPKNNVFAGNTLSITTVVNGSKTPIKPLPNIITIADYTYVKSKMFVKCSLADEWNDNGISVKSGEFVDFKMQFSNAGSTAVVLSELINLKPQLGDLSEFGSSPRNSTLNINYNCDAPTIFTNGTLMPTVNFRYAQNSVTMDRSMLCPPQTSGNEPSWTSTCNNANWLSAVFDNFTLLPGDYVDVIYKGKVEGVTGTAFNSFAFRTNCNMASANSNRLAIKNDNDTGIGCNSCTLSNLYSNDMKILFENLLRNLLTRKINGETDAQINGSNPAELVALKPYITSGDGNKIYNFISTVNAANKITSIKFSFSPSVENDITFLEEKGLNYNPEVGFIDPSYLKIDTTLYSSSNDYLTTCRKTLDTNGNVISDCNSKTLVRHIDFCPARFCYPMTGEIKTGD